MYIISSKLNSAFSTIRKATADKIGTLSNRRRRPDDGNRKRDISFETTLRMYQTLWPDVTQRQNDCACFKSLAWFSREKEWAP